MSVDDELGYYPELADVEEEEGSEIILDDEPEVIEPKDEINRLRDRYDELERRISAPREAAPREQPENINPAPAVTPRQSAFDRQKFAEKYNADPMGALAEFAENMRQDALREVHAARVPIAIQQTRYEIDRYRREAKLSEDEAIEFDSMVDSIPEAALAEADPKSVRKQLDLVRRAAIGTAYEKRKAAPVRRAPVYTASTYASAPAKGAKSVRLTAAQTKFFNESKRQFGHVLSDKDILANMKENGI